MMHRNRNIRATALAIVCLCAAAIRPAGAQPAPSFPVTLPGAVRYATDNYPSILAAQARVAAQQSGVDLARIAYLPRIDSTFQINRATRNNVPGLLLPGISIPSISGPVSDTTSFSSIWGSAGGVLLTWEAFDFGLRGATVDLARAQVTRARASEALTRLEVGVSTADAFLRLAAAQETVRAARAGVERQQVFGDAVAVRVKNQLRPGADDSRAQAELALARIQLIQAEQAEQVSRAILAQWLGVPTADVRINTEGLLVAAPPPSTSPEVERHPLAEVQMANVDSVHATQDVLSRSFVPRINFQTAYAVRGSGALANGRGAPFCDLALNRIRPLSSGRSRRSSPASEVFGDLHEGDVIARRGTDEIRPGTRVTGVAAGRRE